MALNHPGSHREGPTVGPSPNYRPFTFSILITGLWGFCLNTDFWRHTPIWGKQPLTQTVEFLLLECSSSLTFILVFFKKLTACLGQSQPVTWQPCLLIGNTWVAGSLHSKVSDSNVCFWSVLWKSLRDPVFLKLQKSELPWFLSLLTWLDLEGDEVQQRGRKRQSSRLKITYWHGADHVTELPTEDNCSASVYAPGLTQGSAVGTHSLASLWKAGMAWEKCHCRGVVFPAVGHLALSWS